MLRTAAALAVLGDCIYGWAVGWTRRYRYTRSKEHRYKPRVGQDANEALSFFLDAFKLA